MHNAMVVGLTGGIASGKSAAAVMLAELGAVVIDTDTISATLTGPNGHACPAIKAHFGGAYLGEDGSLDRARMRELIFRDARAKVALEGILHPLIREQALAQAAAADALAVIVIPLLFESMSYRGELADVAVVDTDESLQLERLGSRPGMTLELARAIIASQLPRALRLQLADTVICNASSKAALQRQVQALHTRWQGLVAQYANAPAPVCQNPPVG